MDNKWDLLESTNEDREKIWSKSRTFAGDGWFRFRHKPTAIAGLIMILRPVFYQIQLFRPEPRGRKRTASPACI